MAEIVAKFVLQEAGQKLMEGNCGRKIVVSLTWVSFGSHFKFCAKSVISLIVFTCGFGLLFVSRSNS